MPKIDVSYINDGSGMPVINEKGEIVIIPFMQARLVEEEGDTPEQLEKYIKPHIIECESCELQKHD